MGRKQPNGSVDDVVNKKRVRDIPQHASCSLIFNTIDLATQPTNSFNILHEFDNLNTYIYPRNIFGSMWN